MKTAALLLTLFALETSAHAFNIQARCEFVPAEGRCTVLNQWARPIRCELFARGQVSSGAYLNESVAGVLLPGQWAYVTVYANNPEVDPLVFVTGNANCAF